MSSINEKVRRVLVNNPGYRILPQFEHELVECCLPVSKSVIEHGERSSAPDTKQHRGISWAPTPHPLLNIRTQVTLNNLFRWQ